MSATLTVSQPELGVVIAKWQDLAANETGQSNGAGRYRDRSVQVTGTFGVGSTLYIEGSNDGVNWITLRDSNETPLSFTAADLAVILEPTAYIRPRVSGGDANTNLTVIIMGVDV